MTAIVKQYLLQDLKKDEKTSYINYINGCKTDTDWMGKVIDRREFIIIAQPECGVCHFPINVNEHGVCMCSQGHDGSHTIINIIESSLQST